MLVIAFSSVGLVAKSAQPGDRLWGVTQVLYGDYARSVETAATVRTELNEARTALNHGDPERARASLQRVQNQLPAISESEGRNDLTASHRQLEQMLNGSPADGSATPPPWAPGFSLTGDPQRKTEIWCVGVDRGDHLHGCDHSAGFDHRVARQRDITGARQTPPRPGLSTSWLPGPEPDRQPLGRNDHG